MDEMKPGKFEMPKFFASMVVYLKDDISIGSAMNALGCITAPREIDGRWEFVCGETDAIYAWDIETALKELFGLCDIKRINEVSNRFGGEIWVIIAFYHYDKYPALIFEGETMETIRELKANISIDAY